MTLISNVKRIASGQPPTTSDLKQGEFAFGVVNGLNRLYGNSSGNMVEEYSIDLTMKDLSIFLNASSDPYMKQTDVESAIDLAIGTALRGSY